jgi:starch synthase
LAATTTDGRASRFHILTVASEAAPWAKTGGLADVVAGLPEALDDLGHSVTLVLPRYRNITPPPGESIARRVVVGAFAHDVVFHVAPLSERRRAVFVDCPSLFERDAYYGTPAGDYTDNDRRFALLAAAALDFAQHAQHERVDIVHAHDWQAGLAPFWLRSAPERWPSLARAGLVFTIHNLAYQGLFPRSTVPSLGLDWQIFTMHGAEFWSQVSFLKAGINYSDMVTTVSPAYAKETLEPAAGSGLDGVLGARGERYVGILNGIDTRTWDPAADPLLPAHYDADHPAGKRECKRVLLERLRLPMGDDALARPLIGMVSRLVDQKGVDLVLSASAALLKLDAAFVFVGTGDPGYEQSLRELAAAYPSRVAAFIGFDERLAHLVEAGADMFLMPSRFEPCGLNQMYSLRYGTVPIVHGVGGLEDTIRPYTSRALRANGFKFYGADAETLARTVQQAVRVFADRTAWERLMRQGMSEDHSWKNSAREYVKVYRRARQEAAGRLAG